MRKFFLFLLLVISLWIWAQDVVDIVFYYARYAYSNVAGYGASLLLFGILLYFFTRLYRQYFEVEKINFQLKKIKIKEAGILVLFFLPILFLNFQRIMFPDADYDVGAYHLFLHRLNRLQNLRNYNLVGGAGGGTYFFTLSYKIFGVFREVLGYRLGTLFNTYLLFLIYVSVYDFIKKFLTTYFSGSRLNLYGLAASALFVIFAYNTLFNLNSYKVDVIGVPLLLEMLHILFFRPVTHTNKVTVTVFFAILASIIIAYKLTFLPYVLVIGICFFISNYKVYVADKRLMLCGFLLLLFPSVYLIYNYSETQNPIFPLYNKFFQSPLYEVKNFKDERWGPRNLLELLSYNIISYLHKERNNEWQIFSVRLLTEYLIVVSIIGLALYNKFKITIPKIRFIFYLSAIALLCNYLLLYTTGYYRYGVLIEVLFGVILILWLYYLLFYKKWVLLGLLLCFMGLQVKSTFMKIYWQGINLSWYEYDNLRKTDNGSVLKDQTRLLLNDYDSGVDSVIKRLNISAFLSSEYNGYLCLLAPQVPIYNINSFGERQRIVDSFEKNKIDTLSQKHNFYTIATKESLMDKVVELNRRHYFVDSIVDIYPKFTLTNTPLYLLKIKHYGNDVEIANKHSILRTDSAGTSPHFFYTSANKFKTFIIEDPYTYNWGYRPDSAAFTVNNQKYRLYIKGAKNKIVTVPEGNKLSFVNAKELYYFIIVQELKSATK